MLLRAGMSVRNALMYNCVSSVLCLIGMIVGVCAGNIGSASLWIFALGAGMFIYIALVDMVSSGVDNARSCSFLLSGESGLLTGARHRLCQHTSDCLLLCRTYILNFVIAASGECCWSGEIRVRILLVHRPCSFGVRRIKLVGVLLHHKHV